MHPKNLAIQDYNYQLDEEKIAFYPLQKRDESKLLVYKEDIITESQYKNLPTILPNNALLVFNNTKVIEARILFTKNTGSTIEIFCLEPHEKYNTIDYAMQQKQSIIYKCLVGGAKKWKEEILKKSINTTNDTIELNAKILEKKTDYFLIEFTWSNANICFAEILQICGTIPLPPYINRGVENNDANTYQTVYATNKGSVAAPTAGLHFTTELLQNLATKKVNTAYVTLHVGAGTFKPVKATTMDLHEMHAEFIDVSLAFIKLLKNNLNNCIITVGTTSLRTIESLYWIGVKIATGQKDILTIQQWDAYELEQNISTENALSALINYMAANNMNNLVTKTQIIIAPPYKLKIARALLTNFHQPKSTLLLLVAAIVGSNWKKIYTHALENNFRFLSYGDGCLLWV